MPFKYKDPSIHQENQISLAIQVYKNGQIHTKAVAAAAFDISSQTLQYRLSGWKACSDITQNSQKITVLEESSLKQWILDMDKHSLSPTHASVRRMTNLLLSDYKASDSVGDRWVTRFIGRHDELQSKYNRKNDHQRAQCEDPEIMKRWFMLVQDIIAKYGILEQDIYNFDETGFQKGVASIACIVHHSTSRVRALQSGNREWVTVIEAINASGRAIPPMIIFAGKVHQSIWYQNIPEDWTIGLRDNGWTNDKLRLVNGPSRAGF